MTLVTKYVLSLKEGDNMERHVCLIPARAGSKSIKDKNLIQLNHKTLVRLAVEKAMEAKAFFMAIYNAPVKYIAVENPMPMKIIGLPEKSQVIQPYEYGDPYSKKTYLWLKNLPNLLPTKVLTEYQPFINGGGGRMKRNNYQGKTFAAGSLERSKTFPGIAKAMATQWG
jgi:hypothetical protein